MYTKADETLPLKDLVNERAVFFLRIVSVQAFVFSVHALFQPLSQRLQCSVWVLRSVSGFRFIVLCFVVVYLLTL
jgi:hypothetical protein